MEVSEESRRSSRVSLDTLHPVSHMLDSYMVPVVFDKTDECRNAKDYESDESKRCSWGMDTIWRLGVGVLASKLLKVWLAGVYICVPKQF